MRGITVRCALTGAFFFFFRDRMNVPDPLFARSGITIMPLATHSIKCVFCLFRPLNRPLTNTLLPGKDRAGSTRRQVILYERMKEMTLRCDEKLWTLWYNSRVFWLIWWGCYATYLLYSTVCYNALFYVIHLSLLLVKLTCIPASKVVCNLSLRSRTMEGEKHD